MAKTNHLEARFGGYVMACYGNDYASKLPKERIDEIRQAFYMGALMYQGMMLATAMEPGLTVSESEVAMAQRVYGELMEEIEDFGEARIRELFAGTPGSTRV